MKSFKILLMAVLTIISVYVFAQGKSNNEPFNTKQKSETIKSNCLMYPGAVMNQFGMYSITEPLLNLSPKEKMKREVMKINTRSTNYQVANDMPCCLSMTATSLNLAPKDKMKREAMKIYSGNTYKCPLCGMNLKEMNMGMGQMMNAVTSDKLVSCFYSRSPMNLSSKEKMKREAVKI